MTEYYKWYKDTYIDEYAFPIPISMRRGKTIVTINVLPLRRPKWEIQVTYIPPARWHGMIPITSDDEIIIYNALKGQKGEIITKIFTLRQ